MEQPMQAPPAEYDPPTVIDLGTLAEITGGPKTGEAMEAASGNKT
jgi:hypothetical protein